MREILRTTDLVLICVVETLFTQAGVHFLVADRHMSTLEGAIGVFPRRILVVDDEIGRARRILIEAGLGSELRDER
jgi:hypothetical protein